MFLPCWENPLLLLKLTHSHQNLFSSLQWQNIWLTESFCHQVSVGDCLYQPSLMRTSTELSHATKCSKCLLTSSQVEMESCFQLDQFESLLLPENNRPLEPTVLLALKELFNRSNANTTALHMLSVDCQVALNHVQVESVHLPLLAFAYLKICTCFVHILFIMSLTVTTCMSSRTPLRALNDYGANILPLNSLSELTKTRLATDLSLFWYCR